jgi:hypothetical protein
MVTFVVDGRRQIKQRRIGDITTTTRIHIRTTETGLLPRGYKKAEQKPELESWKEEPKEQKA